jgi:hypothetical protein
LQRGQGGAFGLVGGAVAQDDLGGAGVALVGQQGAVVLPAVLGGGGLAGADVGPQAVPVGGYLRALAGAAPFQGPQQGAQLPLAPGQADLAAHADLGHAVVAVEAHERLPRNELHRPGGLAQEHQAHPAGDGPPADRRPARQGGLRVGAGLAQRHPVQRRADGRQGARQALGGLAGLEAGLAVGQVAQARRLEAVRQPGRVAGVLGG